MPILLRGILDLTGNGPDTFTRLDAKRREQTPQALARLAIVSLFVALWAVFWVARAPMPVPFLIALLLEVAFFLVYWRIVFILPNVRSVALAQYVMLAAEIAFHTTMVYFLGGLSWLGSFAYVFGLIYTNAFLDFRKGLLYTTGACAAFAALILLEATGAVPHYQYLAQGPLRYSDPRLVTTTLVCATGVFFSIYIWSSWVGQQLRRERDAAIRAQDELLDARTELQEANDGLERRVRARAVELELANAALRDSDARLRTVITNAPIVLFALDKEGAFTLLEGKALETMNARPEQIIGRSAFDVYANAPAVVEAINRALAGEQSTTLTPGGSLLLEAQLGPMRDDRGNIIGVIGVATDITERKRAENALRESDERYRLVVESALDAVVTIDAEGIITEWNLQAAQTFGWPSGEALGRSLTETIIPAQHRGAHLQGLSRFLATGAASVLNRRIEITALHRDGHQFPIELSVSQIVTSGEVAFSAFVRDITERKRAEDALRESEETLKSTIESTADGILVVNNTGRVIYANRVFADMWHIPRKLLELRDDEKLLEYVLSQLQEPEAFISKVKDLYESSREDLDTLDFKDGSAFERYSRPLMLNDRIAGRVWSFRNVTESKRAERELAEQARRDPLTGLLNRRAGLSAVEERLTAACHNDGRLAIFVLDLDKFKSINDRHSHEMGDAALVRLSDVLSDLFGGRGIVCRLGADEFEIALDNTGIEEAVELAEQLRVALRRSLNDPNLQPLPAFTASIGIACFPEDGESAVDLGRRADEAMYAGKAAGGDAVRAWRGVKRDLAA